MADVTLGSAIVGVTADLSQLVAQFAEARRLRDQFDADMVAQSGGLLKLTEAANQAAEALAGEGDSATGSGKAATGATAALNDEAAAHKAVADAAGQAGVALDSETQKQDRLSAAIDKTIARANDQRTALTRAGEQTAAPVINSAYSTPMFGDLFGPQAEQKGAAEAQAAEAAIAAEGAAQAATATGAQAAAVEDLSKRTDKLLGSVDANYAAQVRWNTTLREAEELFAAGAITEGELDRVRDLASAHNLVSTSQRQEAAEAEQLAARRLSLLSSTDKTFSSQQRWNKALAEGQALLKAGAISEAEFAGVKTVVEKGLKDAAEAENAVGTAAHANTGALREFIVLLREAGRGDFTRMAGSATILGTRLGVLEAVGLPLLGLFAAIGVVGGVVAAAFLEGSQKAAELSNTLSITNNTAALTAIGFEDMAERIAKARDVTQSAAEGVLKGFVETGRYGGEALENLSEGAIKFARLTGQSADDVVKSWSKMADDPVKFAEELANHYRLVTDAGTGLTANQIELARRLQEAGDKMGAINVIASSVKAGLDEQAEHVGYLTGAWRSLTGAIGGAWGALQNWGRDTSTDDPALKMRSQIQDLIDKRDQLQRLDTKWGSKENEGRISDLNVQLAGLGQQLNKVSEQEQRVADTRQKSAAAQRATIQANDDEASTYKRMVDRSADYSAALKKLDADRAAANANLKANPNNKQAQDTASFYNDQYGSIQASLRKQYLPATDAADRKAERAEESAEKKAEREAEALEKRRQKAIADINAEATTLTSLLPLYRDQAVSLEEINTRKEIATKLTELGLPAESREGQQIASSIRARNAATAAIDGETKARAALDAIKKKTQTVNADRAALGSPDTTGEVALGVSAMRAIDAAVKAENDAVDAALIAGTKTYKQAQDDRTAIALEAVKLRAQAEEDEAALRDAQKGLDTEQFRRQYYGTDKVTKPTGADAHALDQALGGKFKKADDAGKIGEDEKKQQAVAKALREANIINQQEYQDRLTKIDEDARAKRKQLDLADSQTRINAAASIADSLLAITSDFAGKNSAVYKAMFVVDKAFAIAKSIVSIQTALASAAASEPFPANLPVIAEIAALGAGIIANITSVAGNFADGGLVRGPGSGMSDDIQIGVSDQEFVVNQQATLRNLPMLRDINAGRQPRLPSNDNGGGVLNVTVHNHASGVTHEAQRGIGPNDVVLIARRVVQSDAPGVVGRDMARANSETSKAVTTHFQAPRRRSQ